MPTNYWIIFVAALVPLIIGFVWYNPKVFGKKWMEVSGITDEKMKSANMGLIFGVTYLFSVCIAFIMSMLVVHQIHTISLLSTDVNFNDPNSESAQMLKKFIELFGQNYRTFKHGAFHGTMAGILLATPVLGINALFERKGFKYIAINAGYWIITFALMGGIICAML